MRRRRSKSSLKRRGPKRDPYDFVLIVCEGEKTEPNYLGDLRMHLKLSSTNVVVTGQCGSAPRSVFDEAVRRFEELPEYDRVYCVIDKDQHPDFEQTMQAAQNKILHRRVNRRKVGQIKITMTPSIPCFEFWILLHYEYTTATMRTFDDVRKRMSNISELASYEKGDKGLFELTLPRLPQALQNADRANQCAHDAGTDNPTTAMPDLVRYLENVREENEKKS